MNIEEAGRELEVNIRAGDATILISTSGLGKTTICWDTFLRIKKRDAAKGIRWGLGVMHGATQTPPDLVGYQFKGERDYGDGNAIPITVATCPLWYLSVANGTPGTPDYDPGGKPAYMYDKFFLIIEEYGQSEGDVKKAQAEIFLHGGTPPWFMPQGSARVACTNEGSRYGVTKDYDHIIYRRGQIRIDPDIDPLIRYMEKPYEYQGRTWLTSPVIKLWAGRHQNIVFEEDPKEQGPKCCPRTLLMGDRYLQVKAEDNEFKIPTDPITMEGLAGKVGRGACESIMGDIQFATQLPSLDDVFKDPTTTPVPDQLDLKLLMTYELAYQVRPEQLTPAITYLERMKAADMSMTFVTSLMRRNYKAFIHQPAMQGWVAKNGALMSLISSAANAA